MRWHTHKSPAFLIAVRRNANGVRYLQKFRTRVYSPQYVTFHIKFLYHHWRARHQLAKFAAHQFARSWRRLAG